MKTFVRIQRGGPTEASDAGFLEYEVECRAGDKVLDALRMIQQAVDPSLCFRWECRAGICGACAVMVDGIPQLSCEAALEPGKTVTVSPLAGFPIIRDLIVDVTPSLARLQRLKPYLISGQQPVVVTKQDAERSKSFRSCIECFACVAAVASFRDVREAPLDPLGIVKLARFASDPRDTENRGELAHGEGIESFTPNELKKASDVCPKHINIVAASKCLIDKQA
jgi:succinate dehydrogenase/fumarate reductase iron-sulfur protein